MSADEILALAEDFEAWRRAYGITFYGWQQAAFDGATKRKNGRFVHPLAGVSSPRGNGKSWAASCVGCWRLQHGPQPQLIVSCALDYEGARICLDHGKAILRSHPDLCAGIEFLADEIRVPSTGSRWLIRSREHTSSRGLHPDLVIYDECGWAKDDELFSSLLAAQSSALDPLMLVVSTVGRSKTGPLWRIKDLAEAQA